MTRLKGRFLVVAFAILRNKFVAADDAENVTTALADSISCLAIVGWWSDCDYDVNPYCAGTFQEYEPALLDPTGNTCYVNPHADPASTTKTVVFWLGPDAGSADTSNSNSSSNIYLYTLRVPDNSVDQYMPTNCTDSGACSCTEVDPLRDPWRTTGECSGDCDKVDAKDLGNLDLDGDCAVLYRAKEINAFFNDTIVSCSIQGKLLDTSTRAPTISPAPSTTIPPTMTTSGFLGSNTKASCSLRLVGLLAALLFLAT